MTSFEDFSLDPRLLAACAAQGFEAPTPIQAEAIPPLLEGHDIIGRARTGSGKTAAFALPLLEAVKERASGVRALVLAPTRELALQVYRVLVEMSDGLPVRILPVYGGTPFPPQLKALRAGVDVVVGTPGRVLDHIGRGTLNLGSLRLFVLDEADEMLRMGFIEDVERILDATPAGRQIALFSATMPDPIRRIAEAWLNEPVNVEVESGELSTSHITQKWICVPRRRKLAALEMVLQGEPRGPSLVFARTRVGCAELADALAKDGFPVDALHGNLSQAARERVLARLRAGRLEILIATDVAARGIDVPHLVRVINVDMPGDPESYVHRIGRTARAGRAGLAITFVEPRERGRLRILCKRIGQKIEEDRLPSPADIAVQHSERLSRVLTRTIEDTDCAVERGWVQREIEQGERSAEDLATAAIHHLAKIRGLQLAAPPPPEPRGSDRRAIEDPVDLFLPMGRHHGLRPADLVGALTREAGVASREIGRITIGVRKAFVVVPRTVASRLVEGDMLNISGTDVALRLARPRGGQDQGKRRWRSGAPGPKRGRHR